MGNSAIHKIDKIIVLVGMMGVGKTTYGKKIANILQVPFIDIDILIENEIGHSVSWIFENVGEEKFRKIEENKIKEVLENNIYAVVALGGGAFLNTNTRKIIKEKAISVWLRSTAETIFNRVSVRKDRPLLENIEDKMGTIKEMMKSREEYYKEADIDAFTDAGNQKEVAAKVISAIEKFTSKKN